MPPPDSAGWWRKTTRARFWTLTVPGARHHPGQPVELHFQPQRTIRRRAAHASQVSGDAKLDAPGFEQTGIELILRTLRESSEKVDILSFGSARALAAAWNRQPDLLREKVNRIHLSAGASSPTFQEWNVA